MPRPKGSKNKVQPKPLRLWADFHEMGFHFGQELVELWRHGNSRERIELAKLLVPVLCAKPLDEGGNPAEGPVLRIIGIERVSAEAASARGLGTDPPRANGSHSVSQAGGQDLLNGKPPVGGGPAG